MFSHNPSAVLSQPEERHGGSVIALEGPEEVVATQLYLLPPSSQIMVLPKIQHYISTSPTSHEQKRLRHRSNPRNIISTIHNAAKRRHSVAMEFLQHSTAERKRAVFLEGGTCGAKLMCLDAIGKAYTAGNLEKAAAIFDRLMSQGFKSLEDDAFNVDSIIDPKSSDTWAGNPDVNKDAWANKGSEANRREDDDDDEMEDPITKAMRAADALDRETENLQPPNHDVDFSVPLDFGLIRPRARSLSMSAVENMVAAPEGVVLEREGDFEMSAAANKNAFQLLPSPLLFPLNPARITTATSFLAISSPKNITQGQLRKARSYEPPQNLREIRFNLRVDDFDNAQMASMASTKVSAQHRDAREELPDGAGIGVATTLLGSGTGTEDKDREWDGTASLSNYSTATPTTHDATHHVGSHATVSPKPPRFHVPLRNLFEKKPRTVEGLMNLDNENGVIGTEGQQQQTSSDETTTKPFEPLLPFNEHYVIHFSNAKPDDQFSLVSSCYKDCFGANLRPSTSTDSPNTDATAISPRTKENLRDMTSIEHNMYPASEYDPYRYEEQLRPAPQSTTPTPGYVFPASFPITPSPSASRFHDLSIHNKTAVWVQNTLRSVLDNHTPVEEIDYLSSASDSSDPQLRSLWEPLMCAGMGQQREAERRVDLILAVGAEGGVKKDFKQAVMAKIEQLGFPSNGDGTSRSGRLGLRYLIGNAMQTFTSQPLTQQSKENPFSNPTLLASLIIPHIDTYLRGNDNVRFLLIEYPVEHLATMLAMQKLMGSQVMKVVGISKEADTTMFSMADYRVSATAPEAEVAECVGAIRDTLAAISDFYKTSDVSTATAHDAVQGERGVPAKALSTKGSNLTSSSVPPLLPPQHSPRHKPSSVVIPTFTAMSTPPPPLLPVSPTDTYNHTHTYVHSNGQNHGHGHGQINTYMPAAAAIHLPTTTRSISPPPCSHCSSNLSTSITRSNTLISHGTVPVATPTVIPPQSPHSVTRERSQRPSISGGSRPTPTPASPSGSSTISPRTRTQIPLSTISTTTTYVQQAQGQGQWQQILPPHIVPVITTTNANTPGFAITTPNTTTTTTTTTTQNRLQSPLSLNSSGPLSSGASGASTPSLLSTGTRGTETDFHTDPKSHPESNLDSNPEPKFDDNNEIESDSDSDPFDFFEIDFEERRLMPMFLKSQIEAHVASSGAATAIHGGHRSAVGNREVHNMVDLETLLGGGRKDFGERFHGGGTGLVCPLPSPSREGMGGGGEKEKKGKHHKGGKKDKKGGKDKKTTTGVAGRNSNNGNGNDGNGNEKATTATTAALEANGSYGEKASKLNNNGNNLKKKKRNTKKNAAPNRPLTPNNLNADQPDPGNGGGNNTYTRPSSRKTTTTMNDQQQTSRSPGWGGMAGGVVVAGGGGGEQRKAFRWLGIA